ncbi:uncharacterized protein PAC_06512 [Phialocephala subalpina]|uniref:Uncharacterized protein n=1 Tax=Phialocephala subalpina TaxID=576137 RepID=A0A1L7WV75_9HELO|nr:uncharacterized protein PAC_06512 [Phialocephala subalpina]
MAPWLRTIEACPFELPTTPPTPCPSPTTLAYISRHTALTDNPRENGDPELQSPTCSPHGVFYSFKSSRATGKYATGPSYVAGQPRPPEIDSQIQNDAQHGERSQRRYSSLPAQFSKARPEPSDGRAWWREPSVIQSPAHAATPASTPLDSGLIKRITDDFSTGSVSLDTNLGKHCSNHPLDICGLSLNNGTLRVHFDCPKVDSDWWNESSEMEFAEPSAEEKERNDM